MSKRISDLGTWSGDGIGKALSALHFTDIFQSKLDRRLGVMNYDERCSFAVSKVLDGHDKISTYLQSFEKVNVLDKYFMNADRVDSRASKTRNFFESIDLLANSNLAFRNTLPEKVFATDFNLAIEDCSKIPKVLDDLTKSLNTINSIAFATGAYDAVKVPLDTDLLFGRLSSMSAPKSAFDAIVRLHGSSVNVVKGIDGFNANVKGLGLELLQVPVMPLTVHLTDFAIDNKQWKLLEDFAQVNTSISRGASKSKRISAKKLKQVASSIVASLTRFKEHKDVKAAYLFLQFVLTIYAVYAAYDAFAHPVATEEYVDARFKVQSERIDAGNKQNIALQKRAEARQAKEYAAIMSLLKEVQDKMPTETRLTTIVQCKLVAEPKGRSAVIVNLPASASVEVLYTDQKWVKVRYIPNPGTEEFTGWIPLDNLSEQ